ncbi:MAG TPA: tRNA (N(6)-L-threonylcarbamoyladenosine(37)-C(2))-methylthiotransferase MtaB [Ktedonobacteraceae bacterium]|nr:tRNA (N(6)-L-threonylcarbamoyladenosine(37)-C(2))-methylthiotransferase MtaB [Ktedonobacteraceae bacterium]
MREDLSSHTQTFAVATLGCKVNQADSEAISEQMSAAGFVQREFNEAADIYIVNTCTVTHLGDRSSRLMISQAHRRQPEAMLVVTGCYAERNPDGVAALPGVDLVIGNQQKDALVETIQSHRQTTTTDEPVDNPTPETTPLEHFAHLAPDVVSPGQLLPMLAIQEQHVGSDIALEIDPNEAEPRADNPERGPLFTDNATPGLASHAQLHTRTRVQMKVQDGCDNRCTYCIVPYVRGGSRSRSIQTVVEHVQRKVRAGFQEIVLTGIHLGDYHPDGAEKRDLGDLIATLLRETEIKRIRVSSLEPEDFRLEWLELWQDSRMCRHFHLPMQSGSDAVLRRMARRYNSARYREIITTAQRVIPGVAISTDIITGFPGESDEDFALTYQLASELHFAKAHVFRFSPRQGTPAARMKGQVKDEIKKARSERLLALNETDARAFRQRFLGTTTDVLIEGRKHGRWEGLTDNYLRVELADELAPTQQNWQNTLVRVHLNALVEDGILGTLVQQNGRAN